MIVISFLCALACAFNLVSCSVASSKNASLSLLPEELLRLIFRNRMDSLHRLVQVNRQWARVVKEVAPYAERDDFKSISHKASEKFRADLSKILPTIKKLSSDFNMTACDKKDRIAKALSCKLFKIYKSLSTLGYPQDCMQMFAEALFQCYINVLKENLDSYLLKNIFPEALISDYLCKRLDIHLTNLVSKGHDRVTVKKWADGLVKVILMLKAHGAPDDFMVELGNIVCSVWLFTYSIEEPGVHFLVWCLSQCQVNIDGRPVALQTDSSGSPLPDLKNELQTLFKNINGIFDKDLLSAKIDTLHKFAAMNSENSSKIWPITYLRELIQNCPDTTLAIELFLRNAINSSQNELLAQIWKELDYVEIHPIMEYMIELYGNRSQKSLLNELTAGSMSLSSYYANADILFTKLGIMKRFESLNGNNAITYHDVDKILDICTDKTTAMELIVRKVIGNAQDELLKDLWIRSMHSEIRQVINLMVASYGSAQQKLMIADLKAEYGKIFNLDFQEKSEESFDYGQEKSFSDDDGSEESFDDDKEEAFNDDSKSNQGMCSIS